jgi:hypothetical protein
MANPADQVMMLAYNINDRIAVYNTYGKFRSAGCDILQLDNTKGKIYHIYCAFVGHDRKRQSNSVYLGAVDK